MKTKLLLNVALMIVTLGMTYPAFAGLSGTYQVVKDDCSSFLFSQVPTVEVRATALKFQVGVNFTYGSVDGSPVFHPAFDYTVGTKKVLCLTDDCYSVYQGGYSYDQNSFREVFFYAEHRNSTPAFKRDEVFSLNGNILRIVSNGKECLLKKVSNLE
jgi:hypothetical protein